MEYKGEIYLSANGRRYDAKSIINIMKMGLASGDKVSIDAFGDGAPEKEAEIKKIIEEVIE